MSVFTDKFIQFIVLHIENFRNGKGIVFLEGVNFQILQQLAYTVNMLNHFPAVSQSIRSVRFEIGEIRIFFDIDDRVDTETGKPLVKPPVDHTVKLIQKSGIFPV